MHCITSATELLLNVAANLSLRSRSGGFAFVGMSNDEEAAKAIAALNEKEVDGRALNVNEACHKAVAGNTPAMISNGPHYNDANRAGGRQRNTGAAGDFSRPQHDVRRSLW